MEDYLKQELIDLGFLESESEILEKQNWENDIKINKEHYKKVLDKWVVGNDWNRINDKKSIDSLFLELGIDNNYKFFKMLLDAIRCYGWSLGGCNNSVTKIHLIRKNKN